MMFIGSCRWLHNHDLPMVLKEMRPCPRFPPLPSAPNPPGTHTWIFAVCDDCSRAFRHKPLSFNHLQSFCASLALHMESLHYHFGPCRNLNNPARNRMLLLTLYFAEFSELSFLIIVPTFHSPITRSALCRCSSIKTLTITRKSIINLLARLVCRDLERIVRSLWPGTHGGSTGLCLHKSAKI